MRLRDFFLSGIGLLGLFGAASAQQSTNLSSVQTVNTRSAAPDYWTPERMRAARPLNLDEAVQIPTGKVTGGSVGASQSSRAQVPASEPKARRSRINQTIKPLEPKGIESDGPYANPYTTGLVFPDSTINYYPYETSGKLFFTDAGVPYSCSGAIVNKRIIITAAHCIYNTTANRGHSNFVFVPSYNGYLTTQPFGSWFWASVRVPTAWVNGCLCFPSAYDFGSIEVQDRLIGPNIWKIGDYLGWLGWTTYSLVGNNVTQLGYPSNLDSARRMITNNSQASYDSSVTGRIGTAMTFGSSGGPWVQDFGRAASGQSITSSGPNRVIGVTSSGVPGQQWARSTILNSAWVSLFNAACARQAGNCL